MTTREVDEHCPAYQPPLAGLAPEQRPLFPPTDLEVETKRPEGAS